jgi:HEAT repeat protein
LSKGSEQFFFDMKQLALIALIWLAPVGPAPAAEPPNGEARRYLLKLLASDSSVDRENAALSLGPLGSNSPEVIAALEKSLADEDNAVRYASAVSLLELGRSDRNVLQMIDQALRDDTGPLLGSWTTANRISQVGPRAKAVVPIALKLLDDPAYKHKVPVMHLLTHIGPDATAAVSIVAKVLNHPKPSERETAALTLAHFGAPARFATPRLAALLQDKEGSVRVFTVFALCRIDPGNKDLKRVLGEMLTDPRGNMRAYALMAIREAGPEAYRFLPAVCDILKNPAEEARLRSLAARAVGGIGLPHARDASSLLKDALRARELSIRLEAARVLMHLDRGQEATVLPVLIRAVEGEDEEGTRLAAQILSEIGPSAAPALPALRGRLKHKSPSVAVAAATALVKIDLDSKEAVPALIGLLKQDSELDHGRRLAIEALQEMGTKAQPARAALTDLLMKGGDSNRDRAIGRALARIHPDP